MSNESLDPRKEQQLSDKQDFEHECLLESANYVVADDKSFQMMKRAIDNNIVYFDEYIDEALAEFPQHIIDMFKYKIGV